MWGNKFKGTHFHYWHLKKHLAKKEEWEVRISVFMLDLENATIEATFMFQVCNDLQIQSVSHSVYIHISEVYCYCFQRGDVEQPGHPRHPLFP